MCVCAHESLVWEAHTLHIRIDTLSTSTCLRIVARMADWAAVEQLEFVIKKEEVDSFFIADANTWSPFLQQQKGFAGRLQLVDAKAFNDTSVASSSNITISNLIIWDSYDAWKAIPVNELINTQNEFKQQFGTGPHPRAIPSNSGWMIYQGQTDNSISSHSSSSSPSINGTNLQTPLGCLLSNAPLQNVCTIQGGDSSSSTDSSVPKFYMIGFFTSIGIIFFLICCIVWLHVRLKGMQKMETSNLLHKGSCIG